MYRDGTILIACCLIGFTTYGASLGMFLPDGTVDFGPEEPVSADFVDCDWNRCDLNLTNEEINADRDIPWNYNVERIEDITITRPVSDPPPASERGVN